MSARTAPLLALALLTPGAAAQSPERGERDRAIGKARDVVAEILAAGAPGLSAAVAVDGQVVWAEGFGFADVEREIPVLETTRFRVGSVAKPFTAAGLMLLVEANKVDLDEPVQTYVPEFPVKEQGVVTTRLVAGHLSGIRHYKSFEFLLNRPFESVTDSLRIFQDDPLRHAPGEKLSYSTFGFTLVSAVIERGSGREFLAYMDDAVFRPLGMNSTCADRKDVVVPGRTTYYHLNDAGPVEAQQVDNSYKWAGGGFLSTAVDMVRFGSAHLSPGFLTEASLETMLTPQRTNDGEESRCGISWFVTQDRAGHAGFQHGGGSVGGTTILFVCRESRVAVALTTNCSRGPVGAKRAARILELFE